jgi:hypothetical protein
MTRAALLVVLVLAAGAAAGCRTRGAAAPAARAATSAPAPAPRPAMASLFGAPPGASGRCRRGFARATGLGRLCYRSCSTGADCPENAACRAMPGSAAGLKLCAVR